MTLNKFDEVSVRTNLRAAEVSWFCDLCGGDTAYLGTIDGERRSSFEHCSNILFEAERLGYQNILLPTSYIVGQDALAFAAAVAPARRRSICWWQ